MLDNYIDGWMRIAGQDRALRRDDRLLLAGRVHFCSAHQQPQLGGGVLVPCVANAQTDLHQFLHRLILMSPETQHAVAVSLGVEVNAVEALWHVAEAIGIALLFDRERLWINLQYLSYLNVLTSGASGAKRLWGRFLYLVLSETREFHLTRKLTRGGLLRVGTARRNELWATAKLLAKIYDNGRLVNKIARQVGLSTETVKTCLALTAEVSDLNSAGRAGYSEFVADPVELKRLWRDELPVFIDNLAPKLEQALSLGKKLASARARPSRAELTAAQWVSTLIVSIVRGVDDLLALVEHLQSAALVSSLMELYIDSFFHSRRVLADLQGSPQYRRLPSGDWKFRVEQLNKVRVPAWRP